MCDVVLCCVCRCGRGVCDTLKKVENPCVDSKDAPVCTFKTSSCMPAPRAHVFQPCARGAGTHGDVFESTHGGVFELTHGTSSPVLLTKNSSRRVLTWPQRDPPKKPLDHTHFQVREQIENNMSPILEGNFAGNQQPDGSISLSRSPLPSLLHHDHHNNAQHTTHTETETHTQTERQRLNAKRPACQSNK